MGSLHSALAAGGAHPHYHPPRSFLALAMAASTGAKGERVAEASVESSASAVEWPAIAAGALAAVWASP